MDNIFQNAVSHFIHNTFFLFGDTMESSAEAVDIEAHISKAYPVEKRMIPEYSGHYKIRN